MQIVGLKQKVVCLSPSLACAWSGTLEVAERVLRALSDVALDPLPSLDAINRTLSFFSKDDLDRVSILGLSASGDNKMAMWGFGSDVFKFSVKGLDGFRIAGSGRDRVLSAVKQIPHEHLPQPMRSSQFGLYMASALSTWETWGGGALDKMTGGGFEIATVGQGRREPSGLIKADGATAVHGTVRFDGKGRRAAFLLRAVTTRTYIDDVLVHLTAGLPADGVEWVAHCVASPLAPEPDLAELRQRIRGTPLESEVILTMFNVSRGDDHLAGGLVLNAERRLDTHAKTFRVEGRFGEQLQIAASPECLDNLLETARKGLRKARRKSAR